MLGDRFVLPIPEKRLVVISGLVHFYKGVKIIFLAEFLLKHIQVSPSYVLRDFGDGGLLALLIKYSLISSVDV